jgi:hypothetical protein
MMMMMMMMMMIVMVTMMKKVDSHDTINNAVMITLPSKHTS